LYYSKTGQAVKINIYIKLQTCLLPEDIFRLQEENAEEIHLQETGSVILVIRSLSKREDALYPDTESVWIIKEGICDD